MNYNNFDALVRDWSREELSFQLWWQKYGPSAEAAQRQSNDHVVSTALGSSPWYQRARFTDYMYRSRLLPISSTFARANTDWHATTVNSLNIAPVPNALAGVSQVLGFRTIREGIDRTVGLLAMLSATETVEEWSGERAQMLANRFVSMMPNETVASGKVAIVKNMARFVTPVATVFQSSDGRCGRIDCGNAAAAIALAIAQNNEVSTTTFSLLRSNKIETIVKATIRKETVNQTWIVTATPRIIMSDISEGRMVEIHGLFNHYTVIDTTLNNFSIISLLNNTDPTCRVVTIDFSTDLPTVTFFTSGRRHPSAPLTGLAVLATLAERVDWLRPLTTTRTVVVNGMPEPLPQIAFGVGTIEFEMPETNASLEPISGDSSEWRMVI